jgi:peptidoglycan-N-acetylglucosamine deacetylase
MAARTRQTISGVACLPARSGAPRRPKLFDRLGIKTLGSSPHSIEIYREQMKAVAAAGHEIGIHG